MNPKDESESEICTRPVNGSWKFEELGKHGRKLVLIHRQSITYAVQQELSMPGNWYHSRSEGAYICGLPRLIGHYRINVEQNDTGIKIAYGRVGIVLRLDGSIDADFHVSHLGEAKDGTVHELFDRCMKIGRGESVMEADVLTSRVGGGLYIPNGSSIKVGGTHQIIEVSQIEANSLEEAFREICRSVDTLYTGKASADIFSPIDDRLFENPLTEPYLSWEQLVKRELGIGKPKKHL